MSKSVAISLSVIERFNLSDAETVQLIIELQNSITPVAPAPVPMSKEQVYESEFKSWMKQYLYPPVR